MGRPVYGLAKRLRWLLALLAVVAAPVARAEEPFSVSVVLEQDEAGPLLSVAVGVRPGHFLYADQLKVRALSGGSLIPLTVPSPVRSFDKFSGEEKEIYDRDLAATYRVADFTGELAIEVAYQGCSDELCFFPETRTFTVRRGGQDATSPRTGALGSAGQVQGGDAWKAAVARFRVAGSATGYMGVENFLSFLEESEETSRDAEQGEDGRAGRGLWASVALILLGGLALNLTPCVLPMIPINIAIIGAGARAATRRRGFALGAVYGLGIAVAYGVLGLVVVLTGSTFGTLNASAWFNWGVAAVFLVLSLALFGVFHIDFSRLQNRFGTPRLGGGGRFAVVFMMGSLAALLAGACVAPVVISVLVWAGELYARGVFVGLLLPFLLGVGMGLPWPLAGAGLSFLPKPGPWMVWVERGFAVLVLVMALYYAHLGYRQLGTTRLRAGGEGASATHAVEENTKLAAQLLDADRSGRPVFIDFWASWCKNCLAMEETTFKNGRVQQELAQYAVIKYAAEKPGDPATKAVLDRFGVIGLPTYVVLRPAGP